MAWVLLLLSAMIPWVSTNTVARVRLSNGRMKRVLLKRNENISSFRARYNIDDPLYINDISLDDSTLSLVCNGTLLACKPTALSASSSLFDDREIKPDMDSCCYVNIEEKSITNKVVLNRQVFESMIENWRSKDRPQAVALLFGTISSRNEVEVEVVWEPLLSSGEERDLQGLVRSAKVSEATVVARHLGLQLVGWLFTHTPRNYILSSEDVLIATALRKAAFDLGHQNCDQFLTLTVESSKIHDQVALEAYQLSNSGYVLVCNNTLSSGSSSNQPFLVSAVDVVVKGRRIRELDTALFTVPVPILSHTGWLHNTHSKSWKSGKQHANMHHLLYKLFEETPDRHKSEPSIDDLLDFNLLLFLYQRLPGIAPLLHLIALRKSTQIPSYYLNMMREIFSGVNS